VEPPSDPPGRSVLDRIKAVEDESRQSRWDEIAVVLDRITGDELWRKQGRGAAVAISVQELATMRDCVLTHNHPLGWQYAVTDPRHAGASFSVEDVGLALHADVAELRAVTPRLRFSLKRPATGWPDSLELLSDYDAIERRVASALLRDVKVGASTQETVTARQAHEVMLRLASVYGLHYVVEVG